MRPPPAALAAALARAACGGGSAAATGAAGAAGAGAGAATRWRGSGTGDARPSFARGFASGGSGDQAGPASGSGSGEGSGSGSSGGGGGTTLLHGSGGGGGSGSGGGGPSPRRLEPSAEEIRAAFAHCAQIVSRHDPEALACAVHLPRDIRARALALRAFNIELLLAGEAVRSKERALAAIRFQWWRDALAQLSRGAPPPAHPVLTALWAASKEAKLSGYHFRRIIDAREEEFGRDKPPLTLEELEERCEATSGQLLYLTLAAGGIASRDADHAASHLGKAAGISLALRGTPFQAARRRALLPLEVCARHKVSQEEIFRGPPAGEELRDAALELGSAARAHLSECRALAPRLPPGAAPLLLPAVLVGEYLRALEARGFDPFDPGLPAGGVSPLRRTLLLKWHALRGTY
ncbi:hypothetical protein Rsub_05394 [Raphidocelis subcapitata]|uniref:Uncharacterized protein n=1 Tax=Raphidocelis subcapitata TaxID=307507 RepID=A0A2V0P6Q6_9CHLO|nr:hypothetical protein Rsub_05394 [Raphidocelis subcapitata]|eukprot:GBF92775.1 hypothetical protein Rsub_05394 [Raphidocelis subcapitata]